MIGEEKAKVATKRRGHQHDLLKPPLKWAGGKRWLVKHLQPIWNEHAHRRLVEPFCGGLAVALGLDPDTALLNDINPHLINFYRWLKRGLHASIPMENQSWLYYKHRDRFNYLLQHGKGMTLEAAELFYYLNRTGYNGLCRFNKRGLYNVPFGKYATINYKRDFHAYKTALKRWALMSGDFESVPVKADDFLYTDPPYDVEFTQYSKEAFGWAEQVRLAEWVSRHSGPAILSNQATERVVHLYRRLGFELRFLDAPRMISCNGNRTRAKEVLATKGV